MLVGNRSSRVQATISREEQRRITLEAICDFIEKKVAGVARPQG